ncbi:3-dehydroquinate synthase [Gloeothece verrucosa]|uniref:3-dehydroquinate synthase n=1 Tax=Gloeothece verrucosa (strain PCC 7822) TaxID=497965 RepID=E0U6G5_GLOV7|nr:3-dehydroquinate synthase [Gloeothece verrucosa]ADN13608.1 3-dehydroquinate synthase [Gloeothece verrucosa PCC 7822]
MYTRIPVKLPQDSYDIVICSAAPHARASLSQLADQISPLNLGKKVLLVSNPQIYEYYGESVVNCLMAAGFVVTTHLIPEGEIHKTLDSITQIYDAALENYLERSSTMIALGGGVIGDMTGFAAATWLRGIPFIQIPTSLLAMVDAAIGGKTGVNHPKGKNLIGAFHQPRLVLIDPTVLKTLPVREFRAGMAEVIKYGVIWDQALFNHLEAAERLDNFSEINQELLQTIVTRSCQAKADVVSKDEKESGLRAILNYGHTIGHAIESLTGYSQILHGEGVAMGMVAAGRIAVKLNMWSEQAALRQDALIKKAGLPTEIPAGVDAEAIIQTLQTDKKVKAGKVRFIFPQEIGTVTITDQVTSDLIREVLAEVTCQA